MPLCAQRERAMPVPDGRPTVPVLRRYDLRRELAPYWSDGCAHESDPVACRRAEIADAVARYVGSVADELIYREWLRSERPRAKAVGA